MSQQETLTRRNLLPHWFVPGAAHFVTWRLYGTLPASVLQQLHERKRSLCHEHLKSAESPRDRRRRIHKLRFADYETALDANQSVSWLSNPLGRVD